MSCVIIFEKDVINFGKNLIKEVYSFLHDDYFLKEFDEVKKLRDYWDKNLVKKFKIFYRKEEKYNLDIKNLFSMSENDLLKKIEDLIKNDEIKVELIENILYDLKLDPEIYEDLYYDKKAFISFFNVYYNYVSYLTD